VKSISQIPYVLIPQHDAKTGSDTIWTTT